MVKSTTTLLYSIHKYLLSCKLPALTSVAHVLLLLLALINIFIVQK